MYPVCHLFFYFQKNQFKERVVYMKYIELFWNRLKNASGNQNAIFNPEFQMLGKKLTYSPAIQGYWKGMVLYNSSAAYGGTIFWRPVSNFIIKGVNLNRNFRKVNGSKNKPL